MLGFSPLSTYPISSNNTPSFGTIYSQVLSATSSNSTSPLVRTIGKLLNVVEQASMITTTTSANFPTLGINNTALGTIAWVNPTNIYSTNSSIATMACTNTSTSNILVATGFGFSIPANVVITGVTVVQATTFGGSAPGLVCYAQLWNGSDTNISDVIGSSKTGAFASSTTTIGSSTDTWNCVLTPTIVNSSTFGVAFWIVNNSGSTFSTSMDSVTIKITYRQGYNAINKVQPKTFTATSVSTMGALTGNVGPSYFTTAVQQQTSGSLAPWTNPDYARLNDGNSATIASDSASGSHDLIFTLGDLTSIPSNATIIGIQLNVTGQTSDTSDGFGAQFGNNTLTTTAYYGTIGAGTTGFDCYFSATGTPQTLVWGGSTNNWSLTGTQLTGAWWNGSNSSINIWSTGLSGASISIENVTMQVWYIISSSTQVHTISKALTSVASNATSIVKQGWKSFVTNSVNAVTLLASKISSSTTYYVTLAATSINNSAFIKQAQKLWTITSVNNSSIVKQDNKPLSVVSVNNTSNIKTVNKMYSTVSTSVNNIIKTVNKPWSLSSLNSSSLIKTGSKLLNSTSVNSTSVIKQDIKPLSVVDVNSTKIIKQYNKPVSTTSVNSTSFIKQAQKILSSISINAVWITMIKVHLLLLSVTSVNSTSLIKQAQKIQSATSVNSTSLLKQILKTLSVTSINNSTLLKQVNKVFTFISSNVTSLLAKIVHLLTLSVVSGNNTSFIKQTSKTLNTVSTSINSIIKQGIKTLTNSSINNTSIQKQDNKGLTTSSVNSTKIIKQDNKTFSVSSINSTSLLKQLQKLFTVNTVNNSSTVKTVNKLLPTISTTIPTIIKQIFKTLTSTSINQVTLLSNRFKQLVLSVVSGHNSVLNKQIGRTIISNTLNNTNIVKQGIKNINVVSITNSAFMKFITKQISYVSSSVVSFIVWLHQNLDSALWPDYKVYVQKQIPITYVTVQNYVVSAKTNISAYIISSATNVSAYVINIIKQIFTKVET